MRVWDAVGTVAKRNYSERRGVTVGARVVVLCPSYPNLRILAVGDHGDQSDNDAVKVSGVCMVGCCFYEPAFHQCV